MHDKPSPRVSVRHLKHSFHGGIHPEENKTISNQTPPKIYFDSSARLYIPLKQNAGQAPKVVVEPGEHLLKGQPIAVPSHSISSSIHAPDDAEVIAIDEGFCGHPSGLPEPRVTLALSDPESAKASLAPHPWQADTIAQITRLKPEQLFEIVAAAGIVGLGGAAFPTQIKLSNTTIDTVIINAMECEPYITCDDVMLQNYAREVLTGAFIEARICQAQKIVLATEDNKPQAMEAFRTAALALALPIDIEILIAPTKYPSGGEKQVLELVTGHQLPKGQLPAAIGVLVQNVGTLFAIYEAVLFNQPLVRRLVTITGDLVKNPGNYWIYTGTPIRHLLNEFLKEGEAVESAIIGGPLMGNRITNFDYPIQKNTNCIILNAASSHTHPWLTEVCEHQACIRCSECEKVCPVNLLPQQLYWFARSEQWDNLQQQDLSDCIECGACAYVCPSEIPLVHYFRYGKSELRWQMQKRQKSERAKQRFEFREFRLKREKEERALKHQQAAAARKKAAAGEQDEKQAAIKAALERVKAKKQASDNPQQEQP